MPDNPYAPPSVAQSSSASGSSAPAPGMAQCSITRKWFPEDELVTFQGQLVSAEGKQILLDRLQTGADAPGGLVRPAVLRRFGCIFLDGILLGVFGLVLDLLLGVSFLGNSGAAQLSGLKVVSGILGLAVAILYFGILHGWKGQSVGKMAGSLRVINMDGTSISKRKAYARAVAYTFNSTLIVMASFLGVLLHNLALISMGLLAAAVWGFTDVIMALVDTRMQRSLHDRICGTRVIYLNS